MNQYVFYRRWTDRPLLPPGESCEDNAGTDNMNIIPIYVICITRQGSILHAHISLVFFYLNPERDKGFLALTFHIIYSIATIYPSLVKSSPGRHLC